MIIIQGKHTHTHTNRVSIQHSKWAFHSALHIHEVCISHNICMCWCVYFYPSINVASLCVFVRACSPLHMWRLFQCAQNVPSRNNIPSLMGLRRHHAYTTCSSTLRLHFMKALMKLPCWLRGLWGQDDVHVWGESINPIKKNKRAFFNLGGVIKATRTNAL